jgi:diguanylate cyclase (GGDEF)-like protein/PAS domain S-box-containing protein
VSPHRDRAARVDRRLLVHLHAARAQWRRWTEPYDPGHPEAPQFRSLQVQSALSLTPFVLLANWANLAVLGWTFRHWEHPVVLTLWIAATAAASAAGLRSWLAWRAGRWPSRNSVRTLAKAVPHACLLAGLWALPMAVGYRHADGVQRPLLVGLSVGMICAGGFALATIPRAAFAYVGVLSAGLVAGLWSAGSDYTLMVTLAAIYAGIVLATVVTSSRQMGGRLVAEADSARQKRLMDLLLDDFQENARDWLWEVSADGRIRYGSLRLAEAFGLPLDALEGASLTSLLRTSLGPASVDEAEAITRLERALVDGHAFRDLHVPLARAGQRRWWSLTGKRLFDDTGRPNGWRGVGADVTRTRQHGAELARLANFDTLTGLANRHQFQERLKTECQRPFTLLYLDLDDFKAINDLHGHTVGDQVLAAVAARFRSAVRRDDLLARIGGDEFALVTWSTARGDAAAAAERLIASLRAPMSIGDLDLRVGTCVGIVLSDGRALDTEGLTRHADMALYAAKARGRNTFQFFQGGMEDAARRRLNLLSDLHDAVAGGQFELHYQPLVRFGTSRIVGAEALMRWHHPTRGLVMPAEFIPLAEEGGLIIAMGQWALREACAMALRWPAHMRVAVNVSARHFLSPAFMEDLRALLARTRLDPPRLEVEITESLLIDDNDAARATLAALRGLGVRVALDDFGTGYSSLAYLRDLPLDSLKIDGAFVQGLERDSSSLEVTRAIVQVARALKMDVTAEGIETQAQYETLLELGCTDAQGYLLGRPMPATALAALIGATPARVVTFASRGADIAMAGR